MRHALFALPLFALAACSTVPVAETPATRTVQLIAINDLHGRLEAPSPVEIADADGTVRTRQLGGVAELASAVATLRDGHEASVTVAAGDLIGASPLASAWFLDEPTIDALDLLGLDLAAVGNHEFDKGLAELRRIQDGGCAVLANRTPCGLQPFDGASFQYLAANVLGADGQPVFPATAVRDFGPVRIGFIGMTLKETANLVTPSGVAGLRFADEAETANALAASLKAQGADAVVLLLHQGGRTPTFDVGAGCDGLAGDVVPIMEKLDPAITTVVSGHTHWAYVCDEGGRLLTSAGKYGYLVTDIELTFDADGTTLLSQSARNVAVEDQPRAPDVAALVDRYVAAAKPHADRVVGTLDGEVPNREDDFESPASNLIADAYLAAAQAPEKGGAQLALVNATGVRVTFPAGPLTYGDAFNVMPFGNTLVVKAFTGAELDAIFEQQYAKPARVKGAMPSALAVSDGFSYAFDLSRAAGDRVSGLTLDGKPIDPDATYRIVTNNYLAAGGDGLSGLAGGTLVGDAGGVDLDALIAWIANGRAVPEVGRIRVLSPTG